MGLTFIFLTMCLYLAWFTWPLKALTFQEVFKMDEINKTTSTKPSKCNQRVLGLGVGSNENNLYLHKVLNKKVLNDFTMEKKKAFYVTPPFELYGKVTSHSYHAHAEEANVSKKDLLEQFTMKRKEAFYITPPYETTTPELNTEKETYSDQEEKVEKQENRKVKNHLDVKSVLDIQQNPASKDKEKPNPVKDAQDLKDSVPKVANGSVKCNDTDKLAAKSYDYDITFIPNNQLVTPYVAHNQPSDNLNPDISDLANKQASIINQLNILGGNKDQVNKYHQQFNALMSELQARRSWGASTVMIMVDETEVKNKLRGDPFVQRVLKMARRRRDEYFKRAQAEALSTLRSR